MRWRNEIKVIEQLIFIMESIKLIIFINIGMKVITQNLRYHDNTFKELAYLSTFVNFSLRTLQTKLVASLKNALFVK